MDKTAFFDFQRYPQEPPQKIPALFTISATPSLPSGRKPLSFSTIFASAFSSPWCILLIDKFLAKCYNNPCGKR